MKVIFLLNPLSWRVSYEVWKINDYRIYYLEIQSDLRNWWEVRHTLKETSNTAGLRI